MPLFCPPPPSPPPASVLLRSRAEMQGHIVRGDMREVPHRLSKATGSPCIQERSVALSSMSSPASLSSTRCARDAYATRLTAVGAGSGRGLTAAVVADHPGRGMRRLRLRPLPPPRSLSGLQAGTCTRTRRPTARAGGGEGEPSSEAYDQEAFFPLAPLRGAQREQPSRRPAARESVYQCVIHERTRAELLGSLAEKEGHHPDGRSPGKALLDGSGSLLGIRCPHATTRLVILGIVLGLATVALVVV